MTQMQATITCPESKAAKREVMPENACQHFHTYGGCGATLRPLEGNCCVFCSYSDELCPPKQAEQLPH
jgi:epoxyqueuosine reductase QueG